MSEEVAESKEERRKRLNREKSARFREKNRDRLNTQDRERRKTDPEYAEKQRANCRRWLKENPEYRKEYKKAWSKENPESVIATKRKSKYGISKEMQWEMFNFQNGKCAICAINIDFVTGHLDHCHVSAKVRGFLCRDCNIMIGMAKEDQSTLLNAQKYLLEAGGQPLTASTYYAASGQEGVVFEEEQSRCVGGLCGT